MTEKQLQAAVVQFARLNGWTCFHTYDARRSQPGLPDLLMFRERILFAELKTERGYVSRDQQRWIDGLRQAGGEVHVWRPSDWTSGAVDAVLGRRGKAAA